MVTRIVTGLALLALLLAAVAAGPVAVRALVAVAVGLACWEWLRLAKLPGAACVGGGLAVSAALAAAAFAGPAPGGAGFTAVCGAASAVWVVFCFVIANRRVAGWKVSRGATLLSAVVFLPAFWWATVRLYGDGDWVLVVSVMAVAWVADSMAYFTGVAFGRHTGRMSPGISPKKSWAGFWGAHAFVLAIAYGVWLAWPQLGCFTNRLLDSLGPVWAAPVIVAFTLLSMAGDLFESALKRSAQVKDSSALLPGHGGVMDRIDSLLAVVPVAAFVLEIL